MTRRKPISEEFKAEIRAYQEARGLKVDGIVAEETWGARTAEYEYVLTDRLDVIGERDRLARELTECKRSKRPSSPAIDYGIPVAVLAAVIGFALGAAFI